MAYNPILIKREGYRSIIINADEIVDVEQSPLVDHPGFNIYVTTTTNKTYRLIGKEAERVWKVLSGEVHSDNVGMVIEA